MNIVLAGGTGFIGKKLIGRLLHEQHTVVLLSRHLDQFQNYSSGVRVERWDARTNDKLITVLDGADAVINLAGESLATGRWTSNRKQRILTSRIESTRAIVSALEQTRQKPSVLLNASAVGYYGNVPEGEVTETWPRGEGFLADVCEQWEAEALQALNFRVRVVLLRTGVVLDTAGGVMKKMMLPFKFFIGGTLGSGKQWFPWIHIDDEVSAIIHSINVDSISGPVNLTAPECVRMEEFSRELGRVLHRPSLMQVPALVLKIAMGEMAEELLIHGQHVVPKKLLEGRFAFQFPQIANALEDLVMR